MHEKLIKNVKDLRNDYQRDGVVVIRKALTDHWIEILRSAIELQVAKGIRYFANRNMRTEPGGFQDFCLHSGIGRIVADLVDSPFTSLVFDQMFVKEPGTKTQTGWHTDQPYWPIAGPIMSTWIALDHVDADNGAMEFIPGSHAWGKKYRPFLTDQNGGFKEYLNIDDPQYSDMPDFEAERDQHRIVSWDMEPGDMLAFDGFIVHSAKGNRTSTRRRRAYAVRYATKGAVYRPDQGVAPWLEDPALQPGDRFVSDKFPLIYGT
ncbi:phytanoyl-CoA dioxygenase family protein [Aliiroseovarius sp. YM-037]|uniref:phytanoyl-CoA dioxygenase family protein n=1 Tax=Aliiroseovarius sp. YM-037 TaxID=3341728 RepID=UPI003A802404